MTCTWPVDRSCYLALPEPSDPTYAARLAQQNAAEDLAVQILWSLSGRQFGVCEATARPWSPPPQDEWRYRYPSGDPIAPFIPVYWGGSWINMTCSCRRRCTLTGPRAAHLPGPVNEIVTVTEAGVVLDPSQYALEGEVLYRVGQAWPPQNLDRPLGEPNTWSVDYLRGYPAPAGVATFVGLLTKEFLAACNGDKCRLPRTVTGVTRQGVSYQVYNPQTIYASGKTGLAEIDLWLAAINPHAAMAAPKVI
ncbi:MAG: hypothetical protein JOY78_00225 [Pseudonocardia sp.]|nr:hypothetical protein [Pseudonocardia sp.]